MQIRHLGHSCLLVRVAGATVLIDPGGFSDDGAGSLTGVDAVAVTHQHPDHVDPGLLARVLAGNPGIPVVAEPQTAHQLVDLEQLASARRAGTEVISLSPGQELAIGQATLTALGGDHAVIHPDIPRVGNIGLLLTGPGEPRLGVTGDSLEVPAEFRGIDVLAFALVAPWSKMRETIDFLREAAPQLALPVHDAIASPAGRAIHLRQATALAPEGTEVRDWAGDRVLEVPAPAHS
ncbi:MBL fold metallo-hydrolase [Brachybacterium hainanense]|uniref:MBL fold metallo-hydrolase n=1 Tax=Brachybacterium hainanense TaxID=1541174 RepID=A0ABV6R7V5_9MICO